MMALAAMCLFTAMIVGMAAPVITYGALFVMVGAVVQAVR
jgi:hypothetical protein